MFDQSLQRIGFCCKYMDPDQTQKPKVLKELQQNFTERQTTVTWLNRQEKSVAEDSETAGAAARGDGLLAVDGRQPEHSRQHVCSRRSAADGHRDGGPAGLRRC